MIKTAALVKTYTRGKLVVGIFNDGLISIMPAKGPAIYMSEDDILSIAQMIKDSK